ncbi:hypothetical protein HUJ05_001938 [Dendroctonus ponderosae]|nr:hypothetical protein HUJ05_001938 [Dendroctonus ponderosae]
MYMYVPYDHLDHLVVLQPEHTRCGQCHYGTTTRCHKCNVGLHVKFFIMYYTKDIIRKVSWIKGRPYVESFSKTFNAKLDILSSLLLRCVTIIFKSQELCSASADTAAGASISSQNKSIE